MRRFYLPLLSLLLLANCGQPNENPTLTSVSSYQVIAYVHGLEDNWGVDFAKANQITHINFAFANIVNGKVTEGSPNDAEVIRKLHALKRVNPNLKILVSVGGWTWSTHFSDVALTADSREVFAQSAVDFLKKHRLDGIDLDWEYPGLPGIGNPHRPEDKENFTALLKLIREKLDAYGVNANHYLLTIATAASQAYLDHTDLAVAHQYLDFINIMTYDYHGAWTPKTGHHSNLVVSKYDDNPTLVSSTIATQQHIAAGIPIEKLVLGVPFYGRWWTGVNPLNNGLYQSAATGKGGGFDYKIIADSLLQREDFTYYWDTLAQAPYLWRAADSTFVTYENPSSLRAKIDFVKEAGMGGLMFWEFNGDNGELLDTIEEHLR
ncbi:MAG: glycoside hydrolase family 18 protein [Saprospiraceae bacterium]